MTYLLVFYHLRVLTRLCNSCSWYCQKILQNKRILISRGRRHLAGSVHRTSNTHNFKWLAIGWATLEHAETLVAALHTCTTVYRLSWKVKGQTWWRLVVGGASLSESVSGKPAVGLRMHSTTWNNMIEVSFVRVLEVKHTSKEWAHSLIFVADAFPPLMIGVYSYIPSPLYLTDEERL